MAVFNLNETNEIDLMDKSVVAQILSEMEKSEDKDRRRDAFDSWQIYSGNSKEYITHMLREKRPTSWQGYSNPQIAISKMITDTISKSYKEKPLREVTDDESGQKTERLHDIYKEGHAHRQLMFMDHMTNLHKYSLFWVTWRDLEQKYQFWSLQPYEFSVIRNKNTGELTCVILNYGDTTITTNSRGNSDGINDLIAEDQHDSGANQEVYAMWTKDNFVLIKKMIKSVQTREGTKIQVGIEYISNPDNPNNENRIGVLPFVFLTKETAIDYPTRSPLMDQTLTSNHQIAEYMTAANISTGQLKVKYPEKFEGMFKKLTRGLMAAIKLPQSSDPDDAETDVTYINPNSDLAGMRQSVLDYISMVFQEHGIKNASIVNDGSASFNSGIERALANASVDDLVMQHNEMYEQVEKQLFQIIKAWDSFLGNNVFDEDDELIVKFKKPTILISDSEIRQNIRNDLELGLITRLDAIKILNPNLSDEEAEAKLEDIENERMNRMARIANGGVNQQGNNARPEQGSEESEIAS